MANFYWWIKLIENVKGIVSFLHAAICPLKIDMSMQGASKGNWVILLTKA